MATIQISDQFGLNLNAQLADTSALLKYVQQLTSLQLQNLDLKKLGGLTLDQSPITSLDTGISFQDPISLGDGAPELTVGAGVAGSLKVIAHGEDLPVHNDPIELPADSRYVAFAIEATVSADLSVTTGSLVFGAGPSTKVEAVSYSHFSPANGISLIDAVGQTVGGFLLPLRSSDLAGLGAGQITRVGASGKLAFSGSANLLAVTNPLLSATLPSPIPAVSLSAGGSVTIGVSCAILTDYEIVARKLDNGAVRLGWYRKAGTEFSVSAQASEGISGNIGSTDILGGLLSVISGRPKADLEELESAGVSEDQALAIARTVQAAASRKVEIAIAGELTAADSHAATFLYDIVPSALTSESQDAIDQALRGDLTKLHAPGLAGVTPVRSVWDNVRERRAELEVNVLGILNFRSVTSLVLDGKVLFEPATGALVLSDQATAQRIQSTQVNFGADTQKLRHVLAESFLITAAYHAASLGEGPSLKCSHSFFDLLNSTTSGDIVRKLNAGVALGLLSPDEVKLPDGVSSFGRTLSNLSAGYDDALLRRMFLDSAGEPLPREAYETAGRSAIQYLVQPDDPDAVRRQPAIDDDLWRKMTAVGQPGFGELFPGVPAPLLGAIVADYSTVVWWADTMCSTAQKLVEVQRWTSQHPGASTGDPGFEKLRADLARDLVQVAADTREEFGQPWGLVAMNQLSTRQAGATMLITGPGFTIERRRDMAAATLP